MDLVLLTLYQKRLNSFMIHEIEQKQVLYEVMGLSDLVRGASDPRTTATAGADKGEFSKARLADRQAEMQRFCRDVIAIWGDNL